MKTEVVRSNLCFLLKKGGLSFANLFALWYTATKRTAPPQGAKTKKQEV
jgi:hypothetical protein